MASAISLQGLVSGEGSSGQGSPRKVLTVMATLSASEELFFLPGLEELTYDTALPTSQLEAS
jgi:hypothetical protein